MTLTTCFHSFVSSPWDCPSVTYKSIRYRFQPKDKKYNDVKAHVSPFVLPSLIPYVSADGGMSNQYDLAQQSSFIGYGIGHGIFVIDRKHDDSKSYLSQTVLRILYIHVTDLF